MNCPWCKREIADNSAQCPHCAREVNAVLRASLGAVARHQRALLWVIVIRGFLLFLTAYTNIVSFYTFENAWVGVTSQWSTFTFWMFLLTLTAGIAITIRGAIVLSRLMRESGRASFLTIACVTTSLIPVIGILILTGCAVWTKFLLGSYGVTVRLLGARTDPPQSRRCGLGLGAWFRAGTVIALLVLAYWGPIRHYLVARWITDGNWSHGWLIPLFSLYFLGTRWEELLRCVPHPSYIGAGLLVASLGLYVWSAWWARMAYPQSLSLIGSIFGVTLLMGGTALIRIVWFPIAFLALAIPLPQSVYVELTRPLRELASTVAASVMPLFVSGLHTEAQAVVIDYIRPGFPPGQLNVEEACSGMRLMMAFATLGVAMAYLGDRPLWQRAVLVLSCVPIAVLCNAIRVTITGLLTITGHREYAEGTPHQLLGIAMLAVAFGCYSAIGYVMSHLFIETTESVDAPGALSGS